MRRPPFPLAEGRAAHHGADCSGAFRAEFERATIRERTSAGIAAARVEGRIDGRRKKLDTAKRREIARLYDINQPTVSRIVAQHRMGSHKIRAI
jgi:DNA invertase Pin-like site-specific DNA recombinase